MQRGKIMSDKQKKLISKNRKGKCLGNQYAKGNKPNKTSFKKGQKAWNKGIKIWWQSPTEIKKGQHISLITEFKKGHCLTPMGEKNWSWKGGKPKCRICNKKIDDYRSKICKKCFRRENHFAWLGGKSFEPYTIDWTKILKQNIRERDKYICQICRKLQKKELFCVHHIDYNKKNCSPENLITLCRSCHGKTQIKRNYWIKYFKKI